MHGKKLLYLCRIRQLSDEEWGCVKREGEAESNCNDVSVSYSALRPLKLVNEGTNENVK